MHVVLLYGTDVGPAKRPLELLRVQYVDIYENTYSNSVLIQN